VQLDAVGTNDARLEQALQCAQCAGALGIAQVREQRRVAVDDPRRGRVQGRNAP
jgi:hypothetical protein